MLQIHHTKAGETMYRLYIIGLLILGTISIQAQESPNEGVNMRGSSLTSAQSNQEDGALTDGGSEPTQYIISAGVSIGIYGGGISVENAEGRKVNPAFWPVPNVSAVIYAPFSAGSNLGGRLDIGMNSSGTKTRPYEYYAGKENWQGSLNEKYTYFTVAPQVSLAGVLLGVGINFPVGGERWNSDLSSTSYYVDNEILASPKLDLRIGGMITAWETSFGKLIVDIQAKYDLGGTFKDNMYVYGYPSDHIGSRTTNYRTDTPINLTTASFTVGIGYLFNVGL